MPLGTSGPIIVPGTDYFEDARENFSETFLSGPGAFTNKLAQGATGPAPAPQVDPEGTLQFESPEAFEGINRDISETLTGDPLAFKSANEPLRESGVGPIEAIRRVLILGIIAIVGVTLVRAFVEGYAGGLAQ